MPSSRLRPTAPARSGSAGTTACSAGVGEKWERIALPAEVKDTPSVTALAAAADGSLWVALTGRPDQVAVVRLQGEKAEVLRPAAGGLLPGRGTGPVSQPGRRRLVRHRPRRRSALRRRALAAVHHAEQRPAGEHGAGSGGGRGRTPVARDGGRRGLLRSGCRAVTGRAAAAPRGCCRSERRALLPAPLACRL